MLPHVFAALLIPVAAHTQQSSDSTAKPFASSIDRYTIDVASVLREGSTARTVSDVLISQVPGLLVVPGSGLNGAGARIRFAGVRSALADVSPIVLLDGMRIDAREDDSELLVGDPGPSRLDDIPIEEVESIEVLHGPASTAVYGPGAAAGVILIRSKRGRSGPVRVEGFAQGGTRAVPSHWPANYGGVDLDNPNAFIQHGGCSLRAEAAGQCVQDFVQSFNPLADRSPFTSAPYRAAGLSATGGTESVALRAAGNIDGDGAALDVPVVTWPNDARNWSLRAGATAHPTRTIDIDASVARISHTLRLPLYQPVLGALLGPSDSSGFSWDSIVHGSTGTQALGRRLVGLNVNARPLPWLAVAARLGFDDVRHDELRGIVGQAWSIGRRISRNHTAALNATASNLRWLGMRFTTTLGVERLSNSDDIRQATLTQQSGSSSTSQLRVKSFGVYGVEQIGINGRLFVTGTLRRNGFEDFTALSATRPDIAIDWIVRPSQSGKLGGVTVHAAYGVSDPPLGGAPFVLVPIGPPGSQSTFKPDRTREMELAAEAAALENRWRARASLYDLRSYANWIELGSQATGFGPVLANGTISNRGLTATASGRLIDRESVAWDLRVSAWGNRNRLLKQSGSGFAYVDLGGGSSGPATNQRETTGLPLNSYWSWPVVSFSDANGDGIITPDEVTVASSFVSAGTPYPTQGAMLTSSWHVARRVHVSATLDYRAGQTLFNQTAQLRCQFELCRESNDPATPLAAQATAAAASLRPLAYFEDADYLKLRELAIAFDLPTRTAGALGAKSGTIMLGGRDLVTWTKYSGADPETASYGQQHPGAPMGISDFGTVPVRPLWMLRVRLSY